MKMGQFFHRFLCIVICVLGLVPAAAYAQYNAFEDPPVGGANATANSFEFGPSKAEIEGGDIQGGQTSQVIVMMRNNASAPLALKTINLAPSSNVTASVAGNQCGTAPIKPGIECPVTISIKAEAPGKYRIGMLINHTGRTNVSNAAITGSVTGTAAGGANGLPANEIEAFPSTVNFETAKGRAPLVRSIALRNASPKSITISDIDLIASPLTGFSVSASNCKELAPSESCVATVTWTPSVEGKSEGVLAMRHTGPSGSLQIPLSGEYQITKTEKAAAFPALIPGQGLIVADRESVDFGTTVDGAASITVSLVNAGDKMVTLRQVKLAGSDNGLSLSADDCFSGKKLDANQGCALTVNWLPRRAGPVIDDIQVIHDGARGILVLPVRGTATQSVSMNLPVLSSNSVPKLDKSKLDEGVLGTGSSGPSRRGPKGSNLATDMSALNGYRVTSLSADRAVITGPRGRLVVQDGHPQIVAGAQWLPVVSQDGVELVGESDSVFLLFDRSLGITSNTSPMATAAVFPAASLTKASAATSSPEASPALPSGGGTASP